MNAPLRASLAKCTLLAVLVTQVQASSLTQIPLSLAHHDANPHVVATQCTTEQRYASEIRGHSTLNGPPRLIFGPPDGQAADFDNAGNSAGFVEVGFKPGVEIVDGPGADFAIHVVDFHPSENEQFRVLASADGQTFVPLGDRGPGGPTTVTFPFDLAGSGLGSARVIRIQNTTIVMTQPYFEGPDIDAIEILHPNCPAPDACPYVDATGNGIPGGTFTHTGHGAGGNGALYDNTITSGADPIELNANTHTRYDFGAGNEKHIRRVVVTNDKSIVGITNTATWQLEYSDTGNVWVPVAGFTLAKGIGNEQIFDFPPSGKHRFWRLQNASGNVAGHVWIEEVEMMEEPVCGGQTECSDGVDNDGDGAVDFPADFSCNSAADDDETFPKAQCQDHQDNDGDGLIDLNDPGCDGLQDDSEQNPNGPQCDNGRDDDGDGLVDQQDPGCTGPTDDDEADNVCPAGSFEYTLTIPSTARMTPESINTGSAISCSSPGAGWELTSHYCLLSGGPCFSAACLWRKPATEAHEYVLTGKGGNFGSHNDCTGSPPGPGYVLKGGGCTTRWTDGTNNCANMACFWEKDTDGSFTEELTLGHQGAASLNTFIAGCHTESRPGFTLKNRMFISSKSGTQVRSDLCLWTKQNQCQQSQCNDGVDNDGDGAVDLNDFSCNSTGDNDETNPKAQCQDGVDNDGDGLIDFTSNQGDALEIVNARSPQEFITLSDATQIDAPSHAFGRLLTLELGPLTFTPDAGGGFMGNVAPFNTPPASNRVKITGPESFNILVPPNTHGFGFDMYEPANGSPHADDVYFDSTFVFTFKNDSAVVHTMTVHPDNGVVRFHGVWLPEPFNRVEIRETTGAAENEYFGPFYFSTVPNGDQGDPGCTSLQDNSEDNVTPQCSDGVDNDGDGAVDLSDFSCSSPQDNDETLPKAQCQDHQDNDGDGLIDLHDPGCQSLQDDDEFNQSASQCSDGIDNDGDGKIDFQIACTTCFDINNGQCGCTLVGDPGCSSLSDDSEKDPNGPQCDNGRDDDGDGKVDFPADPGCAGPTDNDERNAVSSSSSSSHSSSSSSSVPAACSDGLDNDYDGLVDLHDPGCSHANDPSERNPHGPQCDNGLDDDGDGLADFPADPGCFGPTDTSEVNGSSASSSSSSSFSSSSSSSSVSSSVSSSSSSSSTATTACNDGIDNDGDGHTDWPQDPGCSSTTDTTERNPSGPQCDNGIDDDNDGLTDFPADVDCAHIHDDTEGEDEFSFELDLTVRDDRDPVTLGERFTYDIRICNEGDEDIEVDVEAELDEDVRFVDASDDGEEDDDEVLWEDVEIDADDCETLELKVKVKNWSVDDDRLRLRVRAGDEEETEYTDVVDDGGIWGDFGGFGGFIGDDRQVGVVTVDKTADSREVQPGSIVGYTITVRNGGGGVAEGIVVEDEFAAGALSVIDPGGAAARGNGLTWHISILGPGEARILRYRARVSAAMRHGQSIHNTVTAHGIGFDRAASDTSVVSVIEQLPQTGALSFAGAIAEQTSSTRLVRRAVVKHSPSADSLPAMIWTTIIVMGVSCGGVLGRKLI